MTEKKALLKYNPTKTFQQELSVDKGCSKGYPAGWVRNLRENKAT